MRRLGRAEGIIRGGRRGGSSKVIESCKRVVVRSRRMDVVQGVAKYIPIKIGTRRD